MPTPDADLAAADALEAALWREFMAPPPAVAPGCELQHLIDVVDGLRLQIKLLQASVDALAADRRY